jgi:hypothetical protein
MYFGFDQYCSFQVLDAIDFRRLTLSQPIALPASPSRTLLEFQTRSEGEDDGIWDLREVQISTDGGTSWTNVAMLFSNLTWHLQRIDLSAFAGQTIRIRFSFWAGDFWGNWFLGWQIDDVVVRSEDTHPLFCFGDGSVTACPCGNASATASQSGCLNSLGVGGQLRAYRNAQISNDTLQLAASQLASGSALFFQGATQAFGGQGYVFGDGVKCTGAAFSRIAARFPIDGNVAYPTGVETPISVRVGITTPGTRYYQVHYRNSADFCTPSTFNYTNGVAVTWEL